MKPRIHLTQTHSHPIFCRLTIILLLSLVVSIQAFTQIDSWKLREPVASNISAVVYDQYSRSCIIFSSSVFIEYKPLTKRSKNKSLFSMRGLSYNSKEIDAAFNINANYAMLFQGDTYYEFDIRNRAVTGTNKWPIPNHWGKKFDAAVQWTDDMIFMFRGTEFVMYTPSTGTTSAEQLITAWAGWPEYWTSIDAATNTGDGFIYFFRKNEFLAYDLTAQAFAEGPRNLKTGEGVQAPAAFTPSRPIAIVPSNSSNQSNFSSNDPSSWCAIAQPNASNDPSANLEETTLGMAGSATGSYFENRLMPGARVAEVRVYGFSAISGIQIVIETPNGQKHEQAAIGKTSGSYETFKMDSDECIVGISGSTGGSLGDYIYSIQFQTTKRVSPTFGGSGRSGGKKPFQLQIPLEGAFTGFIGIGEKFLKGITLKYNLYRSPHFVVNEETGETLASKSGISAASEGTMRRNPRTGRFEVFEIETEESNNTNVAEGEYRDDHKHYNINEVTFGANSGSLRPIPSTDWLEKGIDILKVNPMEVVKSKKKGKVFSMVNSKSQGGLSSEYTLPHGIDFESVNAASQISSKSFIKTFKELSKTYGQSVGVEGGVAGIAKGSLSTSYKNINKDGLGTEKIYFVKDNQKLLYRLVSNLTWVNDDNGEDYRQKLNMGFRKSIEKLKAPSQICSDTMFRKGKPLSDELKRFEKEYMKIINIYGTHLVGVAEFGGSYVYTYEVSKKQIQSLRKREDKLEASLEGAVKKVSLGASFSVENKNASSNSSENETFKAAKYVTGGSGALNEGDWDAKVNEFPAITRIELFPVNAVLSEVFFPNDPDIEKKAATLRAITNYYLVQNTIEPISKSYGDFFKFPKQALKAKKKLDEEEAVKEPTTFTYTVEVKSLKCDKSDESGESQYYGKVSVNCSKVSGDKVLFKNDDGDPIELDTGESDTSCSASDEFSNIDNANFTFNAKFKEYDSSAFDVDDDLGKGSVKINNSELTLGKTKTKTMTLSESGNGEKITITVAVTKNAN